MKKNQFQPMKRQLQILHEPQEHLKAFRYKTLQKIQCNGRGQITSTFNNHVSIKKMREFFPKIISNGFEFTEVTEESVKKRF